MRHREKEEGSERREKGKREQKRGSERKEKGKRSRERDKEFGEGAIVRQTGQESERERKEEQRKEKKPQPQFVRGTHPYCVHDKPVITQPHK